MRTKLKRHQPLLQVWSVELVEYADNDKEKKTNISKSTAPQMMKLDGGLDHMYTKARKFLAPAV